MRHYLQMSDVSYCYEALAREKIVMRTVKFHEYGRTHLIFKHHSRLQTYQFHEILSDMFRRRHALARLLNL